MRRNATEQWIKWKSRQQAILACVERSRAEASERLQRINETTTLKCTENKEKVRKALVGDQQEEEQGDLIIHNCIQQHELCSQAKNCVCESAKAFVESCFSAVTVLITSKAVLYHSRNANKRWKHIETLAHLLFLFGWRANGRPSARAYSVDVIEFPMEVVYGAARSALERRKSILTLI